MSMSDPIADMLTRIRNAILVSYDTVDIPNSKIKLNLAKILKNEGFIKNYKVIKDNRQGILKLFLKYDEKGEPLISGLKRISKSSARIYAKKDKIPSVLNGYGVNILSTSKGLVTDKEAKKAGIGGEIICSIW
jgi:small subunit ribosomal protein S8